MLPKFYIRTEQARKFRVVYHIFQLAQRGYKLVTDLIWCFLHELKGWKSITVRWDFTLIKLSWWWISACFNPIQNIWICFRIYLLNSVVCLIVRYLTMSLVMNGMWVSPRYKHIFALKCFSVKEWRTSFCCFVRLSRIFLSSHLHERLAQCNFNRLISIFSMRKNVGGIASHILWLVSLFQLRWTLFLEFQSLCLIYYSIFENRAGLIMTSSTNQCNILWC